MSLTPDSRRDVLDALVAALSERGLLLERAAHLPAIQLEQGAAQEALALAAELGVPVVPQSRVSARLDTGQGVTLSARCWRPSDVAVSVAEVAVRFDELLASGSGRALGVDAQGARSWPEFARLAADPQRPLGVSMMGVFEPFGSFVLAEFETGEFGSVPVPSSAVVETFAGLLASELHREAPGATVWVSRQAAPLLGALSRLAFEHAGLLASARALEAPRVRVVPPVPSGPVRAV